MQLDDIVKQAASVSFMDNLQESVVFTDSVGIVVYSNLAFQNLTRTSNTTGRNLFLDYPFKAAKQKLHLLEKSIRDGQIRKSTWVNYNGVNGSSKYVNIKMTV